MGERGWARTAREGGLLLVADFSALACPAARPLLLLHSRGVAPGSQTFAPQKAVYLLPLSHVICEVSKVGRTPPTHTWQMGTLRLREKKGQAADRWQHPTSTSEKVF